MYRKNIPLRYIGGRISNTSGLRIVPTDFFHFCVKYKLTTDSVSTMNFVTILHTDFALVNSQFPGARDRDRQY